VIVDRWSKSTLYPDRVSYVATQLGLLVVFVVLIIIIFIIIIHKTIFMVLSSTALSHM